MTTTPDKKIINYDDKKNLLISILKQPIIYEDRTTAWEQISDETGISVKQCMDEWKNMRTRLGYHKDKVFIDGKMDWTLARDFLLQRFEESKLKNSPAPAPSPAPSPSPSSSPSPSPSSSRVLSPQEEAQNNVPNRLKEGQQPKIQAHMDTIEFIVQRLPADDAEKLIQQFTELAIKNMK